MARVFLGMRFARPRKRPCAACTKKVGRALRASRRGRAVFLGTRAASPWQVGRELRAARSASGPYHGLEAGPFHVQVADPNRIHAHLVEPLLRLMLRPDDPWRPEAAILTDDNFVKPLERALLALYGARGLDRYAVFACGNRPGLPETRLSRISFHGIDVERTLSDFLSFAQACSAGRRKWVETPSVTEF